MNSAMAIHTPKTLAFDIYGTLIDTHGVLNRLESLIGEIAGEFFAGIQAGAQTGSRLSIGAFSAKH